MCGTPRKKRVVARDVSALEATIIEEEFDLRERQVIVFDSYSLPDVRSFERLHPGEKLDVNSRLPGLAVHWVEIVGPLGPARASAGYRLMFGGVPLAIASTTRSASVAQAAPVPMSPDQSVALSLAASCRNPASRWPGRAASCRNPASQWPRNPSIGPRPLELRARGSNRPSVEARDPRGVRESQGLRHIEHEDLAEVQAHGIRSRSPEKSYSLCRFR